jgi:uroporphyrinogen-III synthase
MSSTSDRPPGRLHWVEWPPETPEMGSFRGRERLERADLVIAGPGVPAVACEAAPEAAPVVFLPSAVASESLEVALRLVRQALLEERTVVWLCGPQVWTPPQPVGQRVGQAAANFAQGECQAQPDLRSWFTEHGIDCQTDAAGIPDTPLAGKWVLLARPRRGVAPSIARLAALGAVVISQPAILIGPPADWGPVDAALEQLDKYNWLVFSSANGVRFLLDRLWQRAGDLRRLAGRRLAAIGRGTAEELARYHLRADVVPDTFQAESLAEALSQEASGWRFLLARASRGREVLAERLSAVGAHVDQIVVYRSSDVCPDDLRLRPVARLMNEGRIDWVTVTSSSIARSLAAILGPRLAKTRLASISPITSGVLAELGWPPAVEAQRYTFEGVIEAMLASGTHHAPRDGGPSRGA